MNSDPLFQTDQAQPDPQVRELHKPQQLFRNAWNFSFKTFLVVMVFATLLVSHVWTSKKLSDAERNLREVRQDFKLLDVQDPSQIYQLTMAKQLPFYIQKRVYLPPGRNYQFCLSLDGDVYLDDDSAKWRVLLEPGTGILTFRVVQKTNGLFQGELTTDWSSSQSGVVPTRRVSTHDFNASRGAISQFYWRTIHRLVVESPDDYVISHIERDANHFQGPYDPTKNANLFSMGLRHEDGRTEGLELWIEPVPLP
ncbi:hypothetical protein C5Y96_00100 [Blastopirellula marina]|uniref:Uncharacterized protein n=1 Tax=Blastopirellula marina TaxID=124 RepID=A0A2S8GBX5_9BACT|nr:MULTISPECIES: hypothetical protein [Pirellulaceae]PQO41810.1 hypothetical protein C5Y96_00100 [Blastopirellula marina]RCS56362.1 hypothetical protein DTL36_00100 [Bremerella cremea]